MYDMVFHNIHGLFENMHHILDQIINHFAPILHHIYIKTMHHSYHCIKTVAFSKKMLKSE